MADNDDVTRVVTRWLIMAMWKEFNKMADNGDVERVVTRWLIMAMWKEL